MKQDNKRIELAREDISDYLKVRSNEHRVEIREDDSYTGSVAVINIYDVKEAIALARILTEWVDFKSSQGQPDEQ